MNDSYIKYVYIILLIIFIFFSLTIRTGKSLNEESFKAWKTLFTASFPSQKMLYHLKYRTYS